jgi:hypothetical protein
MPRLGGRAKGTPNKDTLVKRAATLSFFSKIMDDKKEAKLWNEFLTDPEPNIVNWQAFKRAVEYKRGMPIQSHTGEDGGPIQVQFLSNVIIPDAKNQA